MCGEWGSTPDYVYLKHKPNFLRNENKCSPIYYFSQDTVKLVPRLFCQVNRSLVIDYDLYSNNSSCNYYKLLNITYKQHSGFTQVPWLKDTYCWEVLLWSEPPLQVDYPWRSIYQGDLGNMANIFHNAMLHCWGQTRAVPCIDFCRLHNKWNSECL